MNSGAAPDPGDVQTFMEPQEEAADDLATTNTPRIRAGGSAVAAMTEIHAVGPPAEGSIAGRIPPDERSRGHGPALVPGLLAAAATADTCAVITSRLFAAGLDLDLLLKSAGRANTRRIRRIVGELNASIEDLQRIMFSVASLSDRGGE